MKEKGGGGGCREGFWSRSRDRYGVPLAQRGWPTFIVVDAF